VIDGSSNTVTTTVAVTAGGPMAVNSAANLVYFLNGFGALSVLDGASNQIVQTAALGKTCCMSIAYGAFANRIYATTSSNDLLIINATSLNFTGTHFSQAVQLIGLAADNASNRVYLNSGAMDSTWSTAFPVSLSPLSCRATSGRLRLAR
jgi:DNA-binding beta-propeller fold protein YncE